jgi:hypothetical protein
MAKDVPGGPETHRAIQRPIWSLAQEPGCLDSQDLNDSWFQCFQLQETWGTKLQDTQNTFLVFLVLDPTARDLQLLLPQYWSCPILTFGAPMGSPRHCAIRPDLQVCFCVLRVICVEVSLPNLTPELEKGTGVRDRACLTCSP